MKRLKGVWFLLGRFSRPAGAGLLLAGVLLGGAASARAQAPQYLGASSCSAPTCHGAIRPRKVPQEARVQLNEHDTWARYDRHRKAHDVLKNQVSKNIARILGSKVMGGQPAEKSPRCLACHSLALDARGKRQPRFDEDDEKEGVSCELCHGPASKWKDEHTRTSNDRAKDHARNVQQFGMYDTRDLIKRAEKCAECHVGADKPNQSVDHELIGAGHPDLVFELDTFMGAMPMHWIEPKEPVRGARNWSTGSAVQIRAQMQRLIRRAGGANWPEFSEMDCFACHHSLSEPEVSWRLNDGDYYGRRRDYRTGDIPFNPSRYAVFRQMAAAADSASARRLDAEFSKLTALLSRLYPPKDQVIATARNIAEVADKLAQRFNDPAMKYDPAVAQRVIREIAGDAENLSLQGARVVEQATMALDALYRAYRGKPPEGEAKAALDNLYRLLEYQRLSGYDSRTFADALRRAGAALR